MRYVENINGLDNLRIANLNIVKENDGRLFLQKSFNENGEIRNFQVEVNFLMIENLFKDVNIKRGQIETTITFLEDDNGQICPYPSNSSIIKNTMNRGGFVKQVNELLLGQEVKFFKESIKEKYTYINKIYYAGYCEINGYCFIAESNYFNGLEMTIRRKRHYFKKLPHIYKTIDNFLSQEELNDIPF